MALSKVGKNQVDQSASLTVDSDLTVDTTTLYVDSTNNRVGIGTSSTNYGKFTVQNTAGTGKVLLDTYQAVPTTENVMAIYADASNGYIESYNNGYKNIIIAGSGGSVGIGTSSHYDASTKLTAAGRINTSNGTAIGSMNYGGGSVINMGSISNHPLQLMTNNTTRAIIDTSGNVGIGISPSYALHTSTSSGVNRFQQNAPTGQAVIHTFSRDGQTAYIGKENSSGSYSFSSGGVADAFAIAHYGSTAPIQIGHTTPEVIIDSSGRVTMPYQPAFSFIGLSNSWANTGAFQTLIPTSTKINRGNHYNGNTGVFTAPVSGVYFFGFWGLVYSNSGQLLNWQYSLNGGVGSQLVQSTGSTGNHTNTSGSIILSLAANDTVTLDVGLSSQTSAVPWHNQWNMYGYLMF